ncbi:MAG: MerR family transcriptional regulator [Chloroflexi bacterium]|nr:MAG: MerR family transcriptional regulator [Chloroflexota bacterium]
MALGRRPVYVISIAAGLAGCYPRTLRIYEEEGLLEPVRTQTNIRLYSDDDLERVRAIRYLTQIRGVNLAGVKLLLQLRSFARSARSSRRKTRPRPRRRRSIRNGATRRRTTRGARGHEIARAEIALSSKRGGNL